MFMFLVSSNCPFRAVDNPEFQAFVKLLRPGINLASRKVLSEKFLNWLFESTKAKKVVSFFI